MLEKVSSLEKMEFVDEMRGMAMKLHTKDQAREGQKEPDQSPPLSKWEPSMEGYLRFYVDSLVVFRTLESIVHNFPACSVSSQFHFHMFVFLVWSMLKARNPSLLASCYMHVWFIIGFRCWAEVYGVGEDWQLYNRLGMVWSARKHHPTPHLHWNALRALFEKSFQRVILKVSYATFTMSTLRILLVADDQEKGTYKTNLSVCNFRSWLTSCWQL